MKAYFLFFFIQLKEGKLTNKVNSAFLLLCLVQDPTCELFIDNKM